MALATRQDLLDWLDRSLDGVLDNPGGWGGVEALEPVVLLLLILRGEVASPSSTRSEVLRRYWSFLAEAVAPGADDLRTRLGARVSEAAMTEILRDHVRSIRDAGSGRTGMRPPVTSPRRPLPRFRAVETWHG